ncbi:MAG: hypothetical protein ACJAW3_001265 [Lentimonas sp.]|jgi:hypothetical protein
MDEDVDYICDLIGTNKLELDFKKYVDKSYMALSKNQWVI